MRLRVETADLLLEGNQVGTVVENIHPCLFQRLEAEEGDDFLVLRKKVTFLKGLRLKKPFPLFEVRFHLRPSFAFIGGMFYARGPRFSLTQEERLPFPFSTYYKFKVPPIEQDGKVYCASLYSKMPLMGLQTDSLALAIAFPPFVKMHRGEMPTFLAFSSEKGTVTFSLAVVEGFPVTEKADGWWGLRGRNLWASSTLEEGDGGELELQFFVGPHFSQCQEAFIATHHERLKGLEPLEPETVKRGLFKALPFYNRIYDQVNKTYLHFPFKDRAGFDSTAFKYSSIGDEVGKLLLFHKVGACLKDQEFREREKELRGQLLQGSRFVKREDGVVWHSTTCHDGKGLRAFTHHGTGFVGFPTGMSTIALNLLEYSQLTEDREMLDLALSTLRWIRAQQRADGAWPATVEVFEDRLKGLKKPKVHDDKPSVAATAESVRALLAAYRCTGEEALLPEAARGLAFINTEASLFNARGYLRDLDPEENDGLSAQSCIHANLDYCHVTGDSSSLKWARLWADYALQFFYWWNFKGLDPFLAFDGLCHTLCPRIDSWGCLLMGMAFHRLGQISQEDIYTTVAQRCFRIIERLQEADGGLCESWFLGLEGKMESIHAEASLIADAFVNLALCLLKDETLVQGKPSTELLPNFIPWDELWPLFQGDMLFLDLEDSLRLSLSIYNPYAPWAHAKRMASVFLRRTGLQSLLYFFPFMRLLVGSFGQAKPLESIKIHRLRPKRYLLRPEKKHYVAGLHEITIEDKGYQDPEGKVFTKLFNLEVLTRAMDLDVKQVALVVEGPFAVTARARDHLILKGQEGFYGLQMSRSHFDRFIEGPSRVAFDITLKANWNFFGRYRALLCLYKSKDEQALRAHIKASSGGGNTP